ncbi:MAG: pseudouridine synthase [Cyclobacteriaceae bacterium]
MKKTNQNKEATSGRPENRASKPRFFKDHRKVEEREDKRAVGHKKEKNSSNIRERDEKPNSGKPLGNPENKRFFSSSPIKKRKPQEDHKREAKPEYDLKSIQDKPKSDADEIRLNKYIANSGICSRRDADKLIESGDVSVNGKVVTELGFKVLRKDRVIYKGRSLNPEKPVYLLLNKPKDYITTTDDPFERKTVMSLVNDACEERLFPVGRLDRNTTGLLLFTNDGELSAKLTHPSYEIKKIYQVTLDKPIAKNDVNAILEGVDLEDGITKVDDLQVLSLDKTILGMEIHSGKNRIVRRIFAHFGYDVVALDRVMFAGLSKKDISRGRYRFLNEKEVINLKYMNKRKNKKRPE